MGDRLGSEARRQEARARRHQAECRDRWVTASDGHSRPHDTRLTHKIARKYKQYNRVRDILSGKVPPPKEDGAHNERNNERKRKSRDVTTTPAKRPRPAETPSRPRAGDNEFASPSIARMLFTPQHAPTSIGPTPQRDGKVLGLFDLLADGGRNEKTPRRDATLSELVGLHGKMQATPSRGGGAVGLHDDEEENDGLGSIGSSHYHGRFARTPVSASKRNLLDRFMTPLRSRDANAVSNRGTAMTPVAVSKLEFATPAFLRRGPPGGGFGAGGGSQPLGTVDEAGEVPSPVAPPIRLPRKPLGRTLSSVIEGLRRLEDERHDDDLEALREMEAADADIPAKPRPVSMPALKITAPPPPEPPKDAVEVDGTQPRLLGAFDDEAMYDSPVEEQLGPDGRPLPVFKKKGQKRTTRRVNMKPTRTRRPQQPTPTEEDEEDGDDVDCVPETQYDESRQAAEADGPEPPSDLEASGSEFEEDVKSRAAGKRDAKRTGKQAESVKTDGTIKRAVRKVNALAHANFRRLKLRNHGAKGGPGHNSRFRRRR